MYTTRFNPTANGPLHIGHAFTALVNQYMAHSTGGRFILRFDDNQRYWIDKLGVWEIQEIAKGQLKDLNWLGIRPDEVYYQSDTEDFVFETLAHSHWRMVVDFSPLSAETEPTIVSEPKIEGWGLSTFLTVERVVLDHQVGANLIIRGVELLQENALYLYFCALLGYRYPACVYMSRLMAAEGKDLSDISKTSGNWKISSLRDQGVEPAEILQILRTSCLINPEGTWSVDNLKGTPRLSLMHSFG